MTLCVCGHPLNRHLQHDDGERCYPLTGPACRCQEYRKAVDSEESTAVLSAGVTPEGLAEVTIEKPGHHVNDPVTITGYVNPDGSGEGNWVTPPTDPEVVKNARLAEALRHAWKLSGRRDPFDGDDGWGGFALALRATLAEMGRETPPWEPFGPSLPVEESVGS